MCPLCVRSTRQLGTGACANVPATSPGSSHGVEHNGHMLEHAHRDSVLLTAMQTLVGRADVYATTASKESPCGTRVRISGSSYASHVLLEHTQREEEGAAAWSALQTVWATQTAPAKQDMPASCDGRTEECMLARARCVHLGSGRATTEPSACTERALPTRLGTPTASARRDTKAW